VTRTIALLLVGGWWSGPALAQDAAAPEAEEATKGAAEEDGGEATKAAPAEPTASKKPAEAEATATKEPAEAPEAEATATKEPAEAPEAEATATKEPAEAPEAEATATKEPAEAPEARKLSSAPMMLPPPPPPEDELPIPTLTIDRIPPSTSYEFAVQVSYGQVSYFRDTVPPWVGFGLRGAWGKNFGLHRIGGQLSFTSEGDMGIHTLLVTEPAVAYDVVTPFGLQLGVSGGPALMYWSDNSTQINERAFGVGPSVAARVGWSQTWTRVGRRLFVFAEPKLRIAGGSADVLVAVAVGSGAGR